MKPENKTEISRGVPFLCIGSNTIVFDGRDGAGLIHFDNDSDDK